MVRKQMPGSSIFPHPSDISEVHSQILILAWTKPVCYTTTRSLLRIPPPCGGFKRHLPLSYLRRATAFLTGYEVELQLVPNTGRGGAVSITDYFVLATCV